MTIKIFSSEKQHILYDGDCLSQIDGNFFEPDYWRVQGRLTEPSGGRGQAFFIDHTDGFQYLLRHYRRGGLAARISRDKYWFSGLENSRPWREFHLTSALYESGLPVPRPLAARVERTSFFYQGDLITLKIPDARPFAQFLDQTTNQELWQKVGSMIARFHKWGLNHVDLNANNILVDTSGKVWLIDFDRCKKMPGQSVGSWKHNNLERLKRSIMKLTGDDSLPRQWADLQNSYENHAT